MILDPAHGKFECTFKKCTAKIYRVPGLLQPTCQQSHGRSSPSDVISESKLNLTILNHEKTHILVSKSYIT